MAGHNGWKTVHVKTPFITAQAGLQTSTYTALGPRFRGDEREAHRQLAQTLHSSWPGLWAGHNGWKAVHFKTPFIPAKARIQTSASIALVPRLRGDERKGTKKVVDARRKAGHDG